MNWLLNTDWKYPNAKTQEEWDMIDRAAIIENAARELIAAMFRDSQRGETYGGRVLEAYSQLDLALAAVPPAPPSSDIDNVGLQGAKASGDKRVSTLANFSWSELKKNSRLVAPPPPSIPEREKVLEALKVGRYCANELMELGEAYLIERTKIESAIAALEGK